MTFDTNSVFARVCLFQYIEKLRYLYTSLFYAYIGTLLWWTPLQSGRCTLSRLPRVKASKRCSRTLHFYCPFIE